MSSDQYPNLTRKKPNGPRHHRVRLRTLCGGAAGGWFLGAGRRLAAARAALDETTADYLLPVTIRDGGDIVRDGPIPIGSFIEGNASFHLDLHFEQLKALRP